MLFYAITGLINAVTSTILGAFVYFKNRKENVNKTFALFCFCIAFWGYAYFIWQISITEESALFWSRVLMIGAVFIPVTYLHFVFTFLDLSQKKKKFLILSYFIASIFLILDFTSLFVKNMEPELYFPYWPKPGIAYHPFLLMFFGYVIYSWYLMWRALKKSIGIEKLQIRYVLFGTLIGFLGGSTNYFLWYEIPIPPFGNGLVAVYIIFITLAILKYHLFEIKVILTELLVGVIALILLIQATTAETFWLKILGLGLVFLFGVVGYFLIKSVLKEIELRKKLQIVYADLKKLDEAKSEFVSIASHQLRTPLTAIKGYISMMLEKTYGEPPEKMTKPLENIYLSNERLIKLVNGLLNISRIEAGRLEMHPEKVFLGEVIASVVGELENGAKNKNIYLKFEKPKEPLPKILVDVEKIREAIMNLIDNAIRYTNKGGVTIKCKIQNEKCIIEITDTGEGMTKEEITHLFESFSRGTAGTRFWTEGAGLGLYVAKKFVEKHDGKIWAESKGKDRGSTFYIELPITLPKKSSRKLKII